MSNIGDVSVFYDNPTATRDSVINGYEGNQLLTIYPGELTKKDDPTGEYQFFMYYPMNTPLAQQELHRLRFKHKYEFVTREEWETPVDTWTWDEAGHLTISGHKVMYRPGALWRKEQEEIRLRANGIVGESLEKFRAKGDEFGLRVEANEIEDADAPRRGRRK